MFWTFTAQSGTNSIFVDASGPLGAFAVEYAGVAPTTAPDATAGIDGLSAATMMDAGPLALTGADLAIAVFGDGNLKGTMTPGSGWDLVAHDDGYDALIEQQLAGAGTLEVTADQPGTDTSTCWFASALAFQAQ